MRTAFDFAPFRRSTIGFDRLFDLMENENSEMVGDNYPPFDLVKVDDNHYRIDLAVAGFRSDEVDITAQQNQLVVTGKKRDDNVSGYIHRGIPAHTFERRFGLADHIQVSGAELKDGLLSIELVREVPESMRPRKIAIGGSTPRHDSIEATAAKAGTE